MKTQFFTVVLEAMTHPNAMQEVIRLKHIMSNVNE